MNTRRTLCALIVVVVSALALWNGSVWPLATDLQPIPVEGPMAPDGRFLGTLTILDVTVADPGRLVLTGLLHGTATHYNGASIEVRRQTFTAPAEPVPDARTTDVVLLQMAPIALAAGGRQVLLAPIPLDIHAIPDEDLLFPTPPHEGVEHRHDADPLSEPEGLSL